MSDIFDKSGMAEFWRVEARKSRELAASAKLTGDLDLEIVSEATARWCDRKADLAEEDFAASQAALARTLARVEERAKKRAHAFGVILGGKHVRGSAAKG